MKDSNSPTIEIGTPLTSTATKVMLLGAGELGKELPIPNIRQMGPSASAVILAKGNSDNIIFSGLDHALAEPDTQLRLFGKPEVRGERRMGVCLAKGSTIQEAREKASKAASCIKYSSVSFEVTA